MPPASVNDGPGPSLPRLLSPGFLPHSSIPRFFLDFFFWLLQLHRSDMILAPCLGSGIAALCQLRAGCHSLVVQPMHRDPPVCTYVCTCTKLVPCMEHRVYTHVICPGLRKRSALLMSTGRFIHHLLVCVPSESSPGYYYYLSAAAEYLA